MFASSKETISRIAAMSANFLAYLGKRPGPDRLGKIASFYKELGFFKRTNVISFLDNGPVFRMLLWEDQFSVKLSPIN